MTARLIIIRHGKTYWNNERRYQGHVNIELSPEGIAQAKELQKRLASSKIDAIYSSDSSRAFRTAEIIAEPHGLKVIPTLGLKEINFGVWEGLTYDEILRDYPEELKIWQESPQDLRIKNGETFTFIRDRAVTAVKEILQEYPGGTVAFVSHGGTIAALICGLLEQPLSMMWKYRQNNTAVNILIKNGNKYEIELLNDTSHLMNKIST